MDCRKEIIFCSKEAVLIWWIRSMPRTDAKNYFSTFEYFLSATERVNQCVWRASDPINVMKDGTR